MDNNKIEKMKSLEAKIEKIKNDNEVGSKLAYEKMNKEYIVLKAEYDSEKFFK